MLKHYILVALRNFRGVPITSAANVLTLSIGLIAFLTAYAFIQFFEHAEQQFPAADRTYVLTATSAFRDGSFGRSNLTRTSLNAAEALRTDFPYLESVARALPIEGETAVSSSEQTTALRAVGVDPEFLDIFPLQFIAGNRRTALATPASVILTRTVAEQLFGAASALGQHLLLDNAVDVTVTGVLDVLPTPSHMGDSAAATLAFDMLTSVDVRDKLGNIRSGIDIAALEQRDWVSGNAFTYVTLRAGAAEPRMFRAALVGFATRRVPPDTRALIDIEFGLVPVRDLLRNSIDDELFSADIGVSMSSILMALGVVVLGVACVNYANLATARAVRRTREVGVRKAFGARPRQIVAQHLLEAGSLTLAALVIALAGLSLGLPVLETMSELPLGLTLFEGPSLWALLSGLVVLVTLVSGLYPALVLAQTKPGVAIRASLARKRLTTVLVGAQFAAASFLLIAVMVTAMQNAALVRSRVRAEADSLVLIQNNSRVTKITHTALREELLRLPQVKSVAGINGLPWQRLVDIAFVMRSSDGSVPPRRVLYRSVSEDFFATMGVKLLAGRVFASDRDAPLVAPSRPIVAAVQTPVIVDRALTAEFGFATPADAVGQLVYMPRRAAAAPSPLQIVGVVEFRQLTFRGAGATSTLYRFAPDPGVAIVRIDGSNVADALAHIDATWRRLAPNIRINRQSLDEAFDRAFATFLRLNQAFTLLALMAVAISTAGLFGMATLIADSRSREIAVRKTFGATRAQIVVRLLASLCMPVVLANVLVWPAAYLAAQSFLSAFLAPITLGPAPFGLASAAALGIACLAVGGSALRVAWCPLAEALRSE
jgi:putative ABC transport system permease protein